MIIDENIISKIRNFSSLGLMPPQIASILKIPPQDRASFIDEFERKDTRVFEAYHQGRNAAYVNHNIELTKSAEKGDVIAIAKLDERKHEQEIETLRQELFGV